MKPNDYPTPIFTVAGRNGYWMIDEYRKNDPNHGTYGSPLGPFTTKRLATAVADALNSAYQRGYAHGRDDGVSATD